MITRDWVRALISKCAAPMMFIAKKDSLELRVYVDYRDLNNIIKKNRYPLPLFDTLIDHLRTVKYFTVLDLISAFHHLQIRKGDEQIITFISRYGLYEYLVIPFRLYNTPVSFQALIDLVIGELTNTKLIIFLNDILIYRDTLEELKEYIYYYLD